MPHPVIYTGDLGELWAEHTNGYIGRDQECVALPQQVTVVGYTGRWQPGARVVDLNFLRPGTVIANFEFTNGFGRFSRRHGYHAALFMSYGNRNMATGAYTHFWVLDQWSAHPVKRRNKNAFSQDEAKRRQILPCDNANEYYLVLVP